MNFKKKSGLVRPVPLWNEKDLKKFLDFIEINPKIVEILASNGIKDGKRFLNLTENELFRFDIKKLIIKKIMMCKLTK